MKQHVVIRARVLGGFFMLVALLLVVRLYLVQVVHGAEYKQEGTAQYIQTDPETTGRGNIYFTTKDGSLVSAAVTLSGFAIAVNPKQLSDPVGAYQKLDAIAPMDRSAFLASAEDTSTSFVQVVDHLSDAQAAAVQKLGIPGVIITPDTWREYPGGAIAAQVLGFVGYGATSTMRAGQYGLEKQYDDTLTKSSTGLFVNPFAEIFANMEDIVATDPSALHGSIITSIEPNVQHELEDTLAGIMHDYTPNFAGGIIMDPKTGEIYAMAVNPSFDPNDYGNVSSAGVYQNIMVSGRYEMGSIMKPLTMAAGIDSGAVSTSTTYDDTGCITVSTAKVCNYDFRARGVIPMQFILNQSLNVGASWVATQTGYPTFTRYMKAYGLGTKTGIDLPNEVTGNLKNLDDGQGPAVNFDTASFGQGITVSPIEMIRALSVLANDGALPNPHIVTAIRYDSGITRTIPITPGPQVLKPSTALTVTNMLRTVYDDFEMHGKIKMEHYTAAAKTGTAQIPDPATGGYIPGEVYLHSFFSYFPATNPRFIVFLFAYKPVGQEYAADTLAMPFYKLAQYLINYYDVPPDR